MVAVVVVKTWLLPQQWLSAIYFPRRPLLSISQHMFAGPFSISMIRRGNSGKLLRLHFEWDLSHFRTKALTKDRHSSVDELVKGSSTGFRKGNGKIEPSWVSLVWNGTTSIIDLSFNSLTQRSIENELPFEALSTVSWISDFEFNNQWNFATAWSYHDHIVRSFTSSQTRR